MCGALCVKVLKSDVLRYAPDLKEILSLYQLKHGEYDDEVSTNCGRPDNVARPDVVSV